MGTVFRKTYTKPMPAEAELFARKGQRFARWKDSKNKTRTAPVTVGNDGTDRLVLESPFFVAKYRDGSGIVREVPTGCRDETAARSVLADLERRAELVKAKVMTGAEDAVSGHQATALTEHFDAYSAYLRAKGVSKTHLENTRRWLDRLAAECSLSQLADMKRDVFEKWLGQQTAEGMSARNRNAHREALVAFCNWAVDNKRMISNPFGVVPKANEKADPRRTRRAMTEEDLRTLLAVACRRPLLDRLTVRRGKRKGEAYADLRPETRERLEVLGRERALLYKTFVLTGLRKKELGSLTVGQLDLDGPVPFAALHAADEKNREGAEIVLRGDLALDLKHWLADMLRRSQEAAQRDGRPIPARLPADTKIFNVPAGLVRILDRDLRLAGIPKRDERGRTLDVHALRTTFGTWLSKGGVPLRTAHAAMRHSDPKLTANVYTDPKLLDVRGALDALPALPLTGGRPDIGAVAKATGTDDLRPSALAPVLAPTLDFSVQSRTNPVKMAGGAEATGAGPAHDVTSSPDKEKQPADNRCQPAVVVGVTGFEPATSWSRTKRSKPS